MKKILAREDYVMRYVLCLLLACLLVALFSLPDASEAASKIDPTKAAHAIAAGAVNAFAVDVYGVLAAESGNLFFSPYSISSALAMTYAGAKGGTASEMAEVLRFIGHEQEIHAAMKSLQDRFNSASGETGVRSWTKPNFSS